MLRKKVNTEARLVRSSQYSERANQAAVWSVFSCSFDSAFGAWDCDPWLGLDLCGAHDLYVTAVVGRADLWGGGVSSNHASTNSAKLTSAVEFGFPLIWSRRL